MIDGVVLVAFDQPEQMRDFDADATFVGYEGSQSLAEVDDVRHVGEHIVGNDEVSLSVSDGHIHAGLLAEEHDLGLNAPAASDLSDVSGWLDTSERIPRATLCCRRYPSLLATSITNELGPRSKAWTASSTNRRAWATQESE